jgi:uncharacterized protein
LYLALLFTFFRISSHSRNLNYLRKCNIIREEISVETTDGLYVRGYFIRNSSSIKSPLIIYFSGNAEAIPPFFLNKLTGWNVAYINYRGYGLSDGTPTEENMKRDALSIYDTLSRKGDVDKNKIVAMGRSSGTGVAIYLAKERLVQGVVLISPYDSIKGVQGDQFPLLPSFLIKNDFKPIELAASINKPLLSFIGAQDRLILPDRSKQLIREWGGESETRIIEDANHDNIYFSPLIYEDTLAFLNDIQGDKRE